MTLVPLTVLLLTSILLFACGFNLLYLSWRAIHLPSPHGPGVANRSEPVVCVQIPIYNERYVAERVIDAVASIDWPRDAFEIQVLDDSDDDTTEIVMACITRWRQSGIAVTHVRRGDRAGYKAGALAYGMTLSAAPFFAVFDADFVPQPDFLRRIMGAFDDRRVAFAHARWGHLNEGYSLFTRLQALAIDFHFLVEQSVRAARGYFTNFTGTAGVWRRSAIEDAGGWSAATLTEDLDLSYRAQLRGWRGVYLEGLVVPQELPVSINAYRRQQSRWATGSFQTAFRLLGPVYRSDQSFAIKIQATMHMLAYCFGPLMLVQLACYPWLVSSHAVSGTYSAFASATIWINLLSVSPWFGFIVAHQRRGRPWWTGTPALLCQVIGAGMSLTALLGLMRATTGGGEFERTPKHRIVTAGQEWRDQAYVRPGDIRALVEAVIGVAALAMVPAAMHAGYGLIAVYSGLFALGFLTLATMSAVEFLEVVTLRRIGTRALRQVRVAAPAVGLFTLCGLALIAAAQMAEPFEDGYQHWLIAATLVQSGQLRDPLFGMQDTWLPAYHLIAAAVLKTFGLWQLGWLKSLGALLGLAVLACVYKFAPNARQGRLAVALLVLNPVFLFTSGSAVAEPLLTASLFGAGLAAVCERYKLAALLALFACLTGTKAWIWIVAVIAVVILERGLRARDGIAMRRHAIAWTAPAIGALVLLQLAFSPATHSLARGSVEVASASLRGSIPADATGRLFELASTFGLAALPILALAPIGLVLALRPSGDSSTAARMRYVFAPALVYIVAVLVLVTDGSYSGSHRYLYPVLPALALLAAGALDRYRWLPSVVAIAASVVLAAGFLPVFAAFAADNAGLVAAGRAARAQPGALITDSPVVAYVSGKAPSDIFGSQVLPANRDQAVSWMNEHGVRSVVIEDISYYRSTTVLADLISGAPQPPFEPIGDQARYTVPGGKRVGVFSVGDPRLSQSVFGTVDAAIDPQLRLGKTAPLAKGLLLVRNGIDAIGEGMGFGTPIVHYADGWVYPRTASTVDLSTTSTSVWKRTFLLDEIGGDAGHNYQFVPITSRGEIEVTYTVGTTGVAIDVRVLDLTPDYSEVAILNEQSAAFDNYADSSQTLTGAAFGNWVPVSGGWARLRSGSLGVEWSVPSLLGADLHGGRELAAPEFDWAGLDYTFSGPFAGAHYVIEVQQAK